MAKANDAMSTPNGQEGELDLATILDKYLGPDAEVAGEVLNGYHPMVRDIQALIAAAYEQGKREGAREELEKIDQAYSWKSIVTYEGFKKWKSNRLEKLQPEGEQNET